MRTTITGKKHITLTVRVPVEDGIRIIKRLWAKKILTDNQYLTKLEQIDPSQAVIVARERLRLQELLSQGDNQCDTKKI